MQGYKILLISILAACIAGGMTAFFVARPTYQSAPDAHDRIKTFYATENAVWVDPRSMRRALDDGTNPFVLVDLRTPQEYEKEHIITAVNIPAHKNSTATSTDDTSRLVGQFANLQFQHPDKDIVVYCYNSACTTGKEVGQTLAEHDIYVKILAIGWNEWRYYWTLWNDEADWGTTHAEDYALSGTEPGKATSRDTP